MRIVMEGLSGAIEITELCRKYNIATSIFYDWKEKLVKNSAEIFDNRGRKNTLDQRTISEQKEEIAGLKDVIAELTRENLEIKKSLENAYRGGEGHEILLAVREANIEKAKRLRKERNIEKRKGGVMAGSLR